MEMRCASMVSAYSSRSLSRMVGDVRNRLMMGWSPGLTLRKLGGVGDQLDENLMAMADHFSPSDEKVLAAHLETIRPIYCRMCGQCDGACRQGLPVADVMRILTYADGYRQFSLG